MNPTVVMTDMGRKNWSDPEVAKPMLDKIPLGKFAGILYFLCKNYIRKSLSEIYLEGVIDDYT